MMAGRKHVHDCITALKLLTAWHKANRYKSSISKQGSRSEYSCLESHLHAAEHGVEELADDERGEEIEENINALHSKVKPQLYHSHTLR